MVLNGYVHLENVSKAFPNGVKAVSDFTLGINDKSS